MRRAQTFQPSPPGLSRLLCARPSNLRFLKIAGLFADCPSGTSIVSRKVRKVKNLGNDKL